MSSYKVVQIDEILNKVTVDLSYLPEGEAFAKTIQDYFETGDFSLKNIQAICIERLNKFIVDTDASLVPLKASQVPAETKAIIGVEIDLAGNVIGEEPPIGVIK